MQKLQLSIPEPCHENWHSMTPTDQGRFCNACVKEVVDFSMMTDTEVLNYFTTITHEKVCGRALPSQLDRTITWPKEPKKRLFWYWNYIVMFFMFFSKSNNVTAQKNSKMVVENVNLPVKPVPSITPINQALEGKVVGVSIISPRPIRIHGGLISIKEPKGLIYIVDGTIVPNPYNINPDDIENVTLLQPSAAAAIYGPIGAGGAMIIATKKLKVKTLDTVVISAPAYVRLKGEIVCTSEVMGGMAKGVAIKRNRIADSIKAVKTLFVSPSNLINVYPNPVKRGSSFALSIKLKHAGNYHIDIIDASGRIQLQKQTNILSKEYIEQVQADTRWSSGVYYIRVFDNNNKPISNSSFIVQ